MSVRHRWSVWCLLALAGCGRIGYSFSGSDAGTPDAAVDMVVVDLPAPFDEFGDPELISELADPSSEDDPSLTADLLEIYFNADRGEGPGGGEIYVAYRASVAAMWDPPEVVMELSTASAETTPQVRADGLEIWFSSDRAGSVGGTLDIWHSTRGSRTAPWSMPEHVPELSSDGDDIEPTLFPDGLHIALSSDRSGGSGEFDVYFADRSTVSAPTWNAPNRVVDLATGGTDDGFPFDLRTFYIRVGTSNADLYVMTRSSPTGSFDMSRELTELNSTSGDGDPWLSPDGRVIFFSSGRSGTTHLYWASR
jgi:hypothetical protein